MDERIRKEMRDFAPVWMKVKVSFAGKEDRQCSTWRGGSILASLSEFDEMGVRKEEYDEMGPSIVHRKCF